MRVTLADRTFAVRFTNTDEIVVHDPIPPAIKALAHEHRRYLKLRRPEHCISAITTTCALIDCTGHDLPAGRSARAAFLRTLPTLAEGKTYFSKSELAFNKKKAYKQALRATLTECLKTHLLTSADLSAFWMAFSALWKPQPLPTTNH